MSPTHPWAAPKKPILNRVKRAYIKNNQLWKERKKDMIRLTNEENKSHENKKFCYICKKEFSTDDDNKKYHKVRDHCHYTRKFKGATHGICNFRYKTTREIPVVFHNGST